uniref:Uncharacterized protein n=1 Tax=Romanomermis culicivorax TaxID=13658 RepID=A0A915JBH5_ROMCU
MAKVVWVSHDMLPKLMAPITKRMIQKTLEQRVHEKIFINVLNNSLSIPVQNRFTISVTGSTKSKGIASGDNLNSNWPRNVHQRLAVLQALENSS